MATNWTKVTPNTVYWTDTALKLYAEGTLSPFETEDGLELTIENASDISTG